MWEKVAFKDLSVLVDIGAGTGFLALLLSEKMKKVKLYTYDISDKLLSWMEDNLLFEPKGGLLPVNMREKFNASSRSGFPDLLRKAFQTEWFLDKIHPFLQNTVMDNDIGCIS